ncbi:PAN2-PAN3 deadenylation complex catalytic subunit PAN2 [Dissostichus eleginoides]|uniref:PAN2-PAN3 deadenylation complex catalytic subunit PAN2 n=1 Tax=Dissostichus eleginoides TaxID=100907 RepID=A0AAD9F9G3_DISEL|nr:PAN2-PAN3 deadenylation complex catalytic subunit PAN2 [Dissostichus eleginoides]
MLPFAVLGLIVWILLFLWRINTTMLAMPVKGEESPPGCGPPAAEEDKPATQSPHPGEHSLSTVPNAVTQNGDISPQGDSSPASTGLEVQTVKALQASSEVSSEKPSLRPNTQRPFRPRGPMLSSGPEDRERLKFILGASEDNSSDEEPLVSKPPSGAAQPPPSAPKPSPVVASSAAPQNISSGMK